MQLDEIFDSGWIRAEDLGGNHHRVTIERVEVKTYDDGKKLAIHFKNRKKGLVCNKTNAGRIAHKLGVNTDNWIGGEIEIYPDMVDFQGKLVAAVRVTVEEKAPGRKTITEDLAQREAADIGIGF